MMSNTNGNQDDNRGDHHADARMSLDNSSGSGSTCSDLFGSRSTRTGDSDDVHEPSNSASRNTNNHFNTMEDLDNDDSNRRNTGNLLYDILTPRTNNIRNIDSNNNHHHLMVEHDHDGASSSDVEEVSTCPPSGASEVNVRTFFQRKLIPNAELARVAPRMQLALQQLIQEVESNHNNTSTNISSSSIMNDGNGTTTTTAVRTTTRTRTFPATATAMDENERKDQASTIRRDDDTDTDSMYYQATTDIGDAADDGKEDETIMAAIQHDDGGHDKDDVPNKKPKASLPSPKRKRHHHHHHHSGHYVVPAATSANIRKRYESFLQYQSNNNKLQRNQQPSTTTPGRWEEESRLLYEDDDDDATIKGDPRHYQIKLLECAMQRNTIVHLGTGMGKTLIALLLIKELWTQHQHQQQPQALEKDAANTPPVTTAIGTTIGTCGGGGGGGGPTTTISTATLAHHRISPINPMEAEEMVESPLSPLQAPHYQETTLSPLPQTLPPTVVTSQHRRQCVFLVPSVALALQQGDALRANLPYTVGTAFGGKIYSGTDRHHLATCDILVSTDGAFLDLLRHYGDLFCMQRVHLLILDECHNSIGNTPYAIIMQTFYHSLPKYQRPRVLGLTASPLINIKKSTCTHDKLAVNMNRLETTLDARVVPLSELGVSEEDVPSFLRKEANESIITYTTKSSSLSSATTAGADEDDSWVLTTALKDYVLHPLRRKEFRQLDPLYRELGPLILSMYAKVLSREISLNTFDQESDKQFTAALDYLKHVRRRCHDECQADTVHQGRSQKLQKLEALLHQQYHDKPETVGLVFVERRVTAMALTEYFRRLHHQQKQRHENVVQLGIDDSNGNMIDGFPCSTDMEMDNVVDEPATTTAQVAVVPVATPPPLLVAQLPQPVLPIPVAANIVAATPSYAGDMGGQFDDAEEEPFVMATGGMTDMSTIQHQHQLANNTAMWQSDYADSGQFDDAEDDPFVASTIPWQPTPFAGGFAYHPPSFLHEAVLQATVPPSAATVPPTLDEDQNITDLSRIHSIFPIRCAALVRKPSNLFKSVAKGHRQQQHNDAQQGYEDEWLHQEACIRKVLSNLRRGKINLLIATSIAEEGIDIQACSFVIALDALKCLKGYIQMKGRARQKDADFFVFQDEAASRSSDFSLEHAKMAEKEVHRFLTCRAAQKESKDAAASVQFDPESFDRHQFDDAEGSDQGVTDEERALRDGRFQSPNGLVTLNGSKSLLHRYALGQPMDSVVRTSKQALRAHLPLFDATTHTLVMPAHLGAHSELRVVKLPEAYHTKTKKEREAYVCLMACVRLYKRDLLNSRLLPLTKNDIERRILDVATKGRRIAIPRELEAPPNTIYVYPILQRGDRLGSYRNTLKSTEHELAIISFVPLPPIAALSQYHAQMGELTYQIGNVQHVDCSVDQSAILGNFFELLLNARWRRRTRKAYFRCRRGHDTPVRFDYRIGCVNQQGQLDWEHMKQLFFDESRSIEERTAAVRAIDRAMEAPRLWCPLYEPNITYIAYNPSGLNCDAHFPFDSTAQGINTYKDYFESRGQVVAADSMLFDVQRMWNLPSRSVPNKDACHAGDDEDTSISKVQPEPNPNEPAYCERLVSVKLPQEGCFEAPLADAGMYLLTLHLPQFLQHVEHHLVCNAFIDHCKDCTPTLGQLLSRLPPEKVIAALTAKRCNPANCYERLEWIGDAVLKLVQTDALMMSTDFGAWVKLLPEGYLSAARSVMGSNVELEQTCKRLSFAKFILTNPLARGLWTPLPLCLEREDAIGKRDARKTPDGKVCADIIEAILGLIYVEFGYRSALDVSDEMQITLPWAERGHPEGPQAIKHPEAMAAAKLFTGCKHFTDPSLVDEAFTHPTDLASDTPSYQRLEWIGDAVLCMAARDWIFRTFPDALVGDMVLMEAVLVCNETLAYLSVHNGLQRYLRHRDQTLPGRIDEYYCSVRDTGRGLWGTDPPKPMGDIVESLLGAAHVDGGFAAGQEATLHVLEPILELLVDDNATKPQYRHPKMDLLELGGKLFSLERANEEEFAVSNPGVEVWHGDEWGNVHPRGQRAVATVRCLGKRIISVCDAAMAAASNRACALVLSMIRENPSMENWVRAARSDLASSSNPLRLTRSGSSDREDSDDSDPQVVAISDDQNQTLMSTATASP